MHGRREAGKLKLLSENDLATIQTALDAGLEIEMTRTMGQVSVSVRTLRVGPPWPEWVHTIMQARRESGHIVEIQNFPSVAAFKEAWEER